MYHKGVRHPHCRGRFGAYLHSLLSGGQIPEPEQRRKRPGAVYNQDHPGSPRNHPQHDQHGKRCEVYGVFVVKRSMAILQRTSCRHRMVAYSVPTIANHPRGRLYVPCTGYANHYKFLPNENRLQCKLFSFGFLTVDFNEKSETRLRCIGVPLSV